MSLKDTSFIHIGMTLCLRTRLRQHNAGYSTKHKFNIEKRPYVLIAYICGFQRNKELMEYIHQKWLENHDNNVLNWAQNAKNIIKHDNDLKLILLFKL